MPDAVPNKLLKLKHDEQHSSVSIPDHDYFHDKDKNCTTSNNNNTTNNNDQGNNNIIQHPDHDYCQKEEIANNNTSSNNSTTANNKTAEKNTNNNNLHIIQPLHSEVISVTEREGLLYVGGYICFKLGELVEIKEKKIFVIIF